jgi:hypothetical protein
MSQTRRLAAILATDVAGYSRLIGADEEGTLNRLRSIRADIIDPKITEHRGRIVKTTGDGLLVEFSSVVDALRCATRWQYAMVEKNTAASGDNRIEFRIGVHQGDIVVEDGDIFGDGVNVAARLLFRGFSQRRESQLAEIPLHIGYFGDGNATTVVPSVICGEAAPTSLALFVIQSLASLMLSSTPALSWQTVTVNPPLALRAIV